MNFWGNSLEQVTIINTFASFRLIPMNTGVSISMPDSLCGIGSNEIHGVSFLSSPAGVEEMLK